MSPNFSLRAGSRLTSSRRPLFLFVIAAMLAVLAINWESAGLRVVNAQSGLVAAYNFDEGVGSTAADSSGLGNNGVVSGGATWVTAGRYGKAVSFVDRGNIVTVADHPSLDLTTAFTLEAWVRPSSVSNTRTVLIKEVPNDLSYALYANGIAQRPIVWARSGAAGFSASGPARLSTDTWTHLAATYNGSTLRLYINGNSVSSRAMTGPLNTSSMALRIGGSTIWDEWYRGLIDDVRIYNRGLSAAEIQLDMATPVGAVDATEPEITVTAPANGAALSGNVTVAATASDNVGVAGVQFYLDGAVLGAEDVTAPYSVAWDTRTAENGTHELTATGHDEAGNTASSSITVTVNNPPRLVILQPPGGASITATTVAISYSTQGDVTEAQHAHFSLDGGAVHIDLSLDGAHQITNVTAGAHTLTGYLARADHSRIVGSDATPVTFTTVAPDTPPTVSVTAPLAGSTLAGNVTARADATDDKAVSGVLFLLDGAPVGNEDTVAPYEIEWDSRTTTNGPHAISARARDAAGNTTTSTVAVTVNNPPRLTIVQPTGGASITGTTVTITYSTQGDLTEARQAHFSLDGGPAQVDLTLDGAFQISNVIGGAHTLTGYLARADQSQIVGSNATPVTFTTVVPDTPPTVSVTAPLAGSTVAGNVTVRADATDDKAVSGVLFLLDGAPVGSEDTVAPYEIVWDSRTTSNGAHAISARARDAAGNTASSTVAVTVNNPPQLLILQPTGGATITGTAVTISYSTQGDLTGAQHAHFSLDGGPVQIDLSLDGAFQITNVTGGAHTLTGYLARADHSQIAGSDATPVSFTTVIPDTPPSVTVTAPVAGSTLAGNVTVRADATDDKAVVGVLFLVDGSAVAAEEQVLPYEIVWNSRTTTNGPHTITARARDAAGNTTSSTVAITVNNPPRLIIVQPTGGASITGTTVTISYSTQGDLAEAQHAHFAVDGGPVQIDLSLDGAFQITNVTGGAHTLTGYLARADHSQIAGSDATLVTFTTVIPDTPPSVSVTAPLTGSTLAGNVTLRADATDDKAVAGVLFLVDGAAVGSEDTVAPYEMVWDSRSTTNGPHAVTARARDAAGNTSSSTVAVTVNNPPQLIILQPAGGVSITGTTVTISYSTQGDLSGAQQVHFSVDGGPVHIDLTLDGAYQISNVTGGVHTLTGYLARADQSPIAGSNATPVTFTTVIPDTPPSVIVTAPVAGSIVAGSVTLRADATDDKAVAGVLFLVDGSPVGNEDTVEPYEIVWDSRTTTNSPHAITAQARDAAGNTTSSTVAITVNNPPRLLILQPAGGATITGATVAISYSTQGDLTGVSHVHFALDGGATLMDMSFDGSYQISNVAPGAHTLTGYLARADHSRIAGTDATPVSFATFVPDTPPSASVTAPLAGSTLSGNVTVRADAADNIGVAGVQFLLDGSALANEDTAAPYEIVWDSRTTANGPHAISARARDTAGNLSVSAAVNIEIANIAQTGPAQIGQWSAPINIPVVAIHQALLPSGQVLMWDAADFTSAPPILFNPQTNTWINRPGVSTDLFCSGHAMLADGRLLVVGGDTPTTGLGVNDVNLFDPTTNAWSTAARMTERRWYPTATTLSDGRVFVMGGYDDCYGASCRVGRSEIFNPTANTWTPMPATANYVTPSYPFLFETPDGKIISAGSYEGTIDTRVLDLAAGTWSVLDSNPIDAGSAVMYAPGKIMKAGKWANSDPPFVAAHANTYVLDLNQPSPQWRASTPMNFARAYNMLTLLPDGTTLATAGSRTTDPGTGGQGVLEAEIWSPDSETWTTMARMQFSRLYHGTSMLLPDGRVLVAGSGRYGSPERLNVEIFSPPYLFKGARPVIASAPELVQPGQTFVVDTAASDIAAVTMVRIGAMTHSFNSDQRFMKLNFTAEPGRLQVEAPSNVHVLLPGYYMLFVINTAGVPSVGAFVRVPVASEDRTAPAAPSGLTATGGLGQATLSWTAATDNVAVTQYLVHRSTTPGFVPSTATLVGTTAGTSYTDVSLAAGVYQYRVVARDAAGNEGAASNAASATVTVTVLDTTAPTVSVTSPAGGTVVSGTVTVTATATDNVVVAGVRFLVDGVQLGAGRYERPVFGVVECIRRGRWHTPVDCHCARRGRQ